MAALAAFMVGSSPHWLATPAAHPPVLLAIPLGPPLPSPLQKLSAQGRMIAALRAELQAAKSAAAASSPAARSAASAAAKEAAAAMQQESAYLADLLPKPRIADRSTPQGGKS